jgi:phosphinothricin acetyltransferase
MASDERPIIRPATERDLPAIHRIYNDEILHGTATWDELPWSFERREQWFAEHDAAAPVLAAELAGQTVGFAYLSRHSAKSGYRYTRENTVYVDPEYQRRGIGRLLLAALVAEAKRIEVRAILARIDSENEGSIALHRELGFEIVGREDDAGFKFGRWLSNVVMELVLEFEPPA